MGIVCFIVVGGEIAFVMDNAEWLIVISCRSVFLSAGSR